MEHQSPERDMARTAKKSSKVCDKLNRGHPTLKDHSAQPRDVALHSTVTSTAAVVVLPGSEVPDGDNSIATASSPGPAGPGRRKAHVK